MLDHGYDKLFATVNDSEMLPIDVWTWDVEDLIVDDVCNWIDLSGLLDWSLVLWLFCTSDVNLPLSDKNQTNIRIKITY